MIIALIIALLAGGGTSFAAENALPGDVLYSVKVHVNEEVRGWLAVSDQAQADWDAHRAERRLEEAEELAADGRLDVQTRADLEALFVKFAEAFQERAEKIAAHEGTQAAFETHSNFEASLKAHERVLLRLSEEEDSDDEAISTLLIEVRAHLKTTEKHRSDDEEEVLRENGSNVQHAAEGKMKAAENKIREVHQFLAKIKDSVSADTFVQAEAKLKTAEDTIVRGKTEMEAGTYGKAFASFQEALRTAQEAKLLVAGQQRIHLDIKILEDAEDEKNEDDKANDEHEKDEPEHEQEDDHTGDKKESEQHSTGSQTQSIKVRDHERANVNLGL